MAHSHFQTHDHDHDHELSPRARYERKKWKLIFTITVGTSFFIVELAIGFRTKSLAVIADAFHYISSPNREAPSEFTFGWKRAELLGAFFNGTFLMALALSIFLQAIERSVSLEKVSDPEQLMIIGTVGFALNVLVLIFIGHDHGPEGGHVEEDSTFIISAEYLAEHELHNHMKMQKPKGHSHDLSMMSVIVHILGDAINNIGVIISGAVIWRTSSPKRFYIDPAISLFISIMILISAYKVTVRSARILLQAAPDHISLIDLRKDLEGIPGVRSVHELKVWSLNEREKVASVHLVVTDPSVAEFMLKSKTISECLHGYGIHTYTVQPELFQSVDSDETQAAFLDGNEILSSDVSMVAEGTITPIPPAHISGQPDSLQVCDGADELELGRVWRCHNANDLCANHYVVSSCGRKEGV